MTAVWLYTEDGRAITCVLAPLPLPKGLQWSGRNFYWDAKSSQYREIIFHPAASEVPEDKRPSAS